MTVKTIEQFIIDAKKIHGDKYDYSSSLYTNAKTKLIIICPDHGEFEQTPNMHLNKRNCPRCAFPSKSNEQWLIDAIKVHGDRYDYSKAKYTQARDKVTIICTEHGEFNQKANNHLNGAGCPNCKNRK